MTSEQSHPWRLGQTSAWFETGGRGVATVSSGKGDHGGVSYGEFQLSSAAGTAQEYIDQSKYKREFEGLTPGSAEFSAQWKEMAEHPEFGEDQYDFIKRTHYDVQVQRLKRSGLDLADRGPAVQDAIWSTSVQMRNLTVPVFQNGLKAKFGDQYDLSSLTDKDIIEAVQEYKFDQTESIFRQSVAQWDNLKDRALREKADLIQFAETGVPVDTLARVRNGHSGHRRASSSQGQEHEDSLLREHSRGDAVGSLQAQLQLLGYTDMHGRPLAIDNDFGPSTKAAVESFQRDHGLPADGVVGPNTRKALQEHARVFIPSHTQDYERPARLDDSSHPDHGFYLRTRELVYRLDQSNGRTPDVRSDQLAAALTVEARSAGQDYAALTKSH